MSDSNSSSDYIYMQVPMQVQGMNTTSSVTTTQYYPTPVWQGAQQYQYTQHTWQGYIPTLYEPTQVAPPPAEPYQETSAYQKLVQELLGKMGKDEAQPEVSKPKRAVPDPIEPRRRQMRKFDEAPAAA